MEGVEMFELVFFGIFIYGGLYWFEENKND